MAEKRKRYHSPEYDAAENERHKSVYKAFIISLKKGEDDDLYRAWRKSQAGGYSTREWLRELFDGAGD